MHFSIPDTQELNEGNGSTFIGYNIHINGVFHCTVRYKQLHNLHVQLKKEYGVDSVPPFPPKKLLPLSNSQLEERRILLEKYIQTIGQDSKLVSSEIIVGFLLSAQQETSSERKQDIHLDIYTMNNYQIPVWVSSFDRTEQVLSKAIKHINLPLEYLQYFSLYLVKKDNSDDIVLLRKLLDFESPYMAHRTLNVPNKIVIRKSYWDYNYDYEVMKDPVALNLLYVQTVTDVEKGWVVMTKDIKSQLTNLQVNLAKREYIEFAQKLKYYGYIQFLPCYCDYPKAQTKVLIAIGDQELNMRIIGPGNIMKEGSFKVTRMRCWRITTTHDKPETAANSRSNSTSLELSFEYLMSKDKLEWITVSSEQAILMSVCLQSIVDELLLKKNGLWRKKNSSFKKNWSYMKRDGSSHLISVDTINSEDENNGKKDPTYQETFSIKKLQEKFSSVSFKNGKDFIENHAFECIGDDDL